MLKKENRISLNKDFDRTFKSGHSFYGKFFKIIVTNNNLDQTRFGILISSKISKKAVVRNKYRRILRELIKNVLPTINSGKDVVFVVFNQILDKKKEEINNEFQLGLKKLKLFSKKSA